MLLAQIRARNHFKSLNNIFAVIIYKIWKQEKNKNFEIRLFFFSLSNTELNENWKDFCRRVHLFWRDGFYKSLSKNCFTYLQKIIKRKSLVIWTPCGMHKKVSYMRASILSVCNQGSTKEHIRQRRQFKNISNWKVFLLLSVGTFVYCVSN